MADAGAAAATARPGYLRVVRPTGTPGAGGIGRFIDAKRHHICLK